MELIYLKMMFIVLAGIIAVIGGLAYQGIKIYFLFKKNMVSRKGKKRDY
jgi:hypothetical protein